MTISFFHDLTFGTYGCFPEYHYWIRRCYKAFVGICYVHTGGLELRIDGGPVQRYPAPVAWLNLRGHVYEYGDRQNGQWSNRFVNFTGPRLDRYEAEGLLPTQIYPPVFAINAPEDYKVYFDELLDLLQMPECGEWQHASAVNCLERILIQLSVQKDDDNQWNRGRRYSEFYQLWRKLSRYPDRGWDFEYEAARLGYSFTHFRRIFKRLFGIAPQQAVIMRRLDLAKELLLSTKLTAKEVAIRVGYDNWQYFNRVFKTHFGVPPVRFRDQNVRDGDFPCSITSFEG